MNRVLEEDFDLILQRVTPRLKLLAGSSLLVTGAAGFIGSYLVDLLAHANERYFDEPMHVVGADNWVSASRQPGNSAHVTFSRTPFGHPFHYLVHAASIASPKFYLAKPLQTLDANVKLTEHLLQRAERSRAMLHISSSEVYGFTPDEWVPTPETYCGMTPFTGPRAVYSESKRHGELLCSIYHRELSAPVKIARPFLIYGPGERLDSGRLVPQLMRALKEKEPFPVYGTGATTRSFLYVADAVVQLLAVLLDGEPGEAYNVGDGSSEVSLREFAELGLGLFPDLMVEYVPQHETMVDAPTRRRPDTTKILGIAPAPAVGLEEGLRRTWRYYSE